MLVVPNELRPSAIHGTGVFLRASVKKGELIWRFDSRIDRIFSQAEFESLPQLQQEYMKIYCCWDESTRVWLMSGDNMRFCNHSDTPNVVHSVGVFSDGVAAFDLPAGTELMSDYNDICDMPLRLEYEI